MKEPISHFHWIPRILAILGILFISIFALDSFEPGKSVINQITDFLIHLIPSFMLIILLILSWRHELMGGLLFLLAGLLFIPLIFSMNYNRTHSIWIAAGIIAMINIPFVITGILFIISHRKTRKLLHSNPNT
jgi:hypothetical protein